MDKNFLTAQKNSKRYTETAAKRVIRKMAKANGDLVGNKIPEKI